MTRVGNANVGHAPGQKTRLANRKAVMAAFDQLPPRLRAVLGQAEGKWSPLDALEMLLDGVSEDAILEHYRLRDHQYYEDMERKVYAAEKLAGRPLTPAELADKYLSATRGDGT